MSTIRLTSVEISSLWSTYMTDSMSVCLLTHFIDTCEDAQIEQILQKALISSQKNMSAIEEVFKSEKIVLPIGFPVEKHVVRNAPKLFTDVFYMQYIIHMSKFGMAAHAAVMAGASRKDIRTLYSQFFQDASHLYELIIEMMLEKGVYIRPPQMPYPQEVDFVNKQKFLNGWFQTRTLLGIEASHLFHNSLHNQIGESVCTGFGQVTKDKKLAAYFLRGKKLCQGISSDIQNILQKSDVPTPSTWDDNINQSTTAPFSDQLMLYIIAALSNVGITTYGAALAVSMRRDLGVLYEKFIADALAYGEDGVNIMIDRVWLEQPPHYMDREKWIKEVD